MSRLVCCLIIALAAPTCVSADTVLLGTSRDTLHRVTQSGGTDTTEDFILTDRIRSLHKDAAGTVYAIGRPEVPFGPTPLYILENATAGTPFLTQVATLSQPYSATVRIGDTVYGYQMDNDLFSIDVSSLPAVVETLVGPSGVITTQSAMQGAAYDPATDTAYVSSTLLDRLYTFDRNTGAVTEGPSFSFTGGTMGMDWFGGTLYAMLQDNGTDRSLMGTIDPLTGDFTTLYDVGPKPEGIIAAGMVVIPEPGTLALLLVSLAVVRRRR